MKNNIRKDPGQVLEGYSYCISWTSQGHSQGRVPGVLDLPPPLWVMEMDIILRVKLSWNPSLEIPRDKIFVFEEEQKKINSVKKASHAILQATIL